MGVSCSQCANLVAIGSHQRCAAVETDACLRDCRNLTKSAQQAQEAVSIALNLRPCAQTFLNPGAAQAASGLLQACNLPARAHTILPAFQNAAETHCSAGLPGDHGADSGQRSYQTPAKQGCLLRPVAPVTRLPCCVPRRAADILLQSSAARAHLLHRAWHLSMRPQGQCPSTADHQHCWCVDRRIRVKPSSLAGYSWGSPPGI